MRKVVWSVKASQDLREAVAYRADLDADEAQRFRDRVVATANTLGGIPTGHPGRRAGTFEKSLSEQRYIMVYALDFSPATATILRLVHGARRFPRDIWPD